MLVQRNIPTYKYTSYLLSLHIKYTTSMPFMVIICFTPDTQSSLSFGNNAPVNVKKDPTPRDQVRIPPISHITKCCLLQSTPFPLTFLLFIMLEYQPVPKSVRSLGTLTGAMLTFISLTLIVHNNDTLLLTGRYSVEYNVTVENQSDTLWGEWHPI